MQELAGRAHGTAPDWSLRPLSREAFCDIVAQRGAELYRDLPWRGIDDPYGVLVSEVMLQQTQVARVMRYWQRWMELFPTVDALAAADVATVLEQWQGLGYNRRALALKRACEACSAERGGELPLTAAELVKLPGIGPATAGGIVAFARDEPAVYIETNVRSVFIHELFPDADEVSDRDILSYVADACPERGARAWYYALLDYGADLKARTPNPSRRSKHYARQSAFVGSRREKRSFVLKLVLGADEGVSMEEVAAELDAYEIGAGRERIERDLLESIVGDLVTEGFFRRDGDILMR